MFKFNQSVSSWRLGFSSVIAIALYELPKIVEARQDEHIFFKKGTEITNISITKPHSLSINFSFVMCHKICS